MASLKPRRFIFIVLACWLVGLLILPGFNYMVDIARVLHNDGQFYAKPVARTENMVVSNAKYLERNRDRFNKYLVGSSLVSRGLAPEWLGPDWSRLSFPASTVDEHLESLKLLESWGMLPEKLMVSIDHIPLYRKLAVTNDYFKKPYPRTLEQWGDFLRFYLYRLPDERDWNYFTHGVLTSAGWLDGEVLKENPRPESVLTLTPHLKPYWQTQLPWVVNVINEIASMTDTDVYFMPSHYKTLAASNIDDFYRFNLLLAQKLDYIDFRPLISRLMTDNRAWMETMHFNEVLGREVVAKLIDSSAPLGVFVNRRNVRQQFEKLVESVQDQLPKLLQSDKSMFVHPSFLGRTPIFRQDSDKLFSGAVKVRREGVYAFVLEGANNPVLSFPAIALKKHDPLILRMTVSVPSPTTMKMIADGREVYSRPLETEGSMEAIRKGLGGNKAMYVPTDLQQVYVPVSGESLQALEQGKLKIQLGDVPGQYTVWNCTLWPLRDWKPPYIGRDMVDFCLSDDTVLDSGRYPGSNIWAAVSGSRNIRIKPRPNTFEALSDTPELLLQPKSFDPGRDSVLLIEMDVYRDTPVTLFWKRDGQSYDKSRSVTKLLRKLDKEKRVYLRVPAGVSDGEFMLTPGNYKGVYRFRCLEMREI